MSYGICCEYIIVLPRTAFPFSKFSLNMKDQVFSTVESNSIGFSLIKGIRIVLDCMEGDKSLLFVEKDYRDLTVMKSKINRVLI